MSNRLVLIVDDEFDIRDSLKTFFELEECSVVLASHGKDALDILQSGVRPSLIILDMMMPIMDGREFLNRFLQFEELKHIPVYIFSAHANLEHAKGATGFLKKPTDLSVLQKLIERHCGISSPSPA